MSEMNKKIKQRWIKALRSGRYKQGDGNLLTIEGKERRFCCLGVLCDLHRKETGKEWRGSRYMNSSGYLPRTVARWAGLTDKDPYLNGKTASDLNDSGKSFKFIASKIEKHL